MNKIKSFFKKTERSKGGSIIQRYEPDSKVIQPGFSDVPAEWQQLREAHYGKWLGDIGTAIIWHEVLPVIPHVDIYVFSPSEKLNRNYYTLVTSGMSDEKMTLPNNADPQLARAELIFYIGETSTKLYQTERPWFVTALSFYAHFPFDYKTSLGSGHTLPNGDPPAPVVEGSLLTTALFLPAIFEPAEFSQNLSLGNEKVNFLWVSFISDKETEFKLKKGINKLADKFNYDNYPQVFNPSRPSIV